MIISIWGQTVRVDWWYEHYRSQRWWLAGPAIIWRMQQFIFYVHKWICGEKYTTSIIYDAPIWQCKFNLYITKRPNWTLWIRFLYYTALFLWQYKFDLYITRRPFLTIHIWPLYYIWILFDNIKFKIYVTRRSFWQY